MRSHLDGQWNKGTVLSLDSFRWLLSNTHSFRLILLVLSPIRWKIVNGFSAQIESAQSFIKWDCECDQTFQRSVYFLASGGFKFKGYETFSTVTKTKQAQKFWIHFHSI